MLQGDNIATAPNLPLIALGSNLGSRSGGPGAVINAAIAALRRAGLKPVAASRLYRSPRFPKGFGPDFVNAVVAADSGLPAPDLLARLHRIEADFGRRRDRRWGPRNLDLDLLAIGAAILPDRARLGHWIGLPAPKQARIAPSEPIVPHPRLHERAFVLVPLAEIAPDWRHPFLGLRVSEMLALLPETEKSAIRPLKEP